MSLKYARIYAHPVYLGSLSIHKTYCHKQHFLIAEYNKGDPMKKIIVNKVRCKKCNDIIESKHSYDFKQCLCGAIFIDGGTDYQRFGWGINQSEEKPAIDDYIDFSYSVYQESSGKDR